MEPTQRDLVVGVFRDRERAQDALAALRDAGFPAADVSLLTRKPGEAGEERSDAADSTDTAATTDTAGAVATGSAVAGGLLGGLAGWLVGTGALVLPGIGPFIAAGALAAALGGAAIGAGVGAVAGALVGLGLPEEEARWYEEEVRRGRTLVTVRANGRYEEARALLGRHGAYDIDRQDADVLGRATAGVAQTTPGASTATAAPATVEHRVPGTSTGIVGPAAGSTATATMASADPVRAPAGPGVGHPAPTGEGGRPRPSRDVWERIPVRDRLGTRRPAQVLLLIVGLGSTVAFVWWVLSRRRRTWRAQVEDVAGEMTGAMAEPAAAVAKGLTEAARDAGKRVGARGRDAARQLAQATRALRRAVPSG